MKRIFIKIAGLQSENDSADLTQTVTIGLSLEPSERLKIDQRVSMSLANRAADDSDSVKTNMYIGLDYKLPRPEDLTLRVSYEHLNFLHGQATQSFSEHNLQTELIWKF